MNKTEKHLFAWLKKNIPGFWTRIESSTSPGFPDTFLAYCDEEGNCSSHVLELKVSSVKAPRVKMKVRTAQKVWMNTARAAGARPIIVCLIPSLDKILLLPWHVEFMGTILDSGVSLDVLRLKYRGVLLEGKAPAEIFSDFIKSL